MTFPLDASTVAILLNAGGLIWGAGKLSTKAEKLDETVKKMDVTLAQVGRDLNQHDVRITVLEERVPRRHD
jgi:hypothetical protein